VAFPGVVSFQVIRYPPESRQTSHKDTKRDQNERETTVVSKPAMTIRRMIGDGLEKCFVS